MHRLTIFFILISHRTANSYLEKFTCDYMYHVNIIITMIIFIILVLLLSILLLL